ARAAAATPADRGQVARGRRAGPPAREVEADAAAVAEIERELRHLERVLAIAHAANEQPPLDPVAMPRAPEPFDHGEHDALEREPLLRVKNRREAKLRVRDPVAVT